MTSPPREARNACGFMFAMLVINYRAIVDVEAAHPVSVSLLSLPQRFMVISMGYWVVRFKKKREA
jgi:hypothetical protein